MNLNLVDPNAKPEDIEGEIGVSDSFSKSETRKKVMENIGDAIQNGDINEYSIEDKEPKIGNEIMVDRADIFPAPREWNFFDELGADKMTLLVKSIYENGLLNPITLWKQGSGSYMILSGHNRSRAYDILSDVTKHERYNHIPAKVYAVDDIDETEARRIIIVSNIAQRAKESARMIIRSIIELTKLEKEKAMYGSGISVNKVIAEHMGLPQTKVIFYRRLNTLNDTLLDAFSAGELTAAAAYQIARLPMDIQDLIAEMHAYSLSATKLKLLRKAKTVDAARKIIESRDKSHESVQYVISTPFKRPSGCTTIPLFIPKDEENAFRGFLADMIQKNDARVSKKTKELIERILFPETI